MRKFEADATANYANPENREDGADAILLDIYHVSKYSGVSEGITAGISPTEARDLAAKLNREADAFDAREKARQEAKKYPQEDGWYMVYAPTGIWTPVSKRGDQWFNGLGSELSVPALKQRIDKYGYKKMTVED